MVEISEEWARKNIGNDFKNTFIITAPDDSMYPTFSNGDLLIVNIAIKCHCGDGVYVDCYGIKKLLNTPTGEKVFTYCQDISIHNQSKGTILDDWSC